MSEAQADWTSHHIEGYAIAALEQGKDGAFHAPLISQIEDNLYVGGCRDGVDLGSEFAYIFSMYPWERYKIARGVKRVEVRMRDSQDVPPADELDKIARGVAKALATGEKVLVHCQAGLNRSNLIAALVLIKSGMTPEEAIALLRERRSPVVLCNRAFEDYLLNLEVP